MQEQSFLSAFDRMPWRAFKNTTSETIPAFALMRVTEFEIVNGEIEFQVAKPDISAQAVYLVNGPTDVPPLAEEGRGPCTTLMQGGNLLVDLASGTPAVGQTWGAKAGQFSAVKDAPGFFVGGAHQGATPRARVAAIQVSGGNAMKIGKPDVSIPKGIGGPVSVYSAVTLTDTGDNVNAIALGAPVPLGKWVTLAQVNGVWLVAPWECP